MRVTEVSRRPVAAHLDTSGVPLPERKQKNNDPPRTQGYTEECLAVPLCPSVSSVVRARLARENSTTQERVSFSRLMRLPCW
jgi:hypothetical protein